MVPFYFVLPALFVLAAKVVLVWWAREDIKKANKWLWFFLFPLFLISLFELMIFPYADNADALEVHVLIVGYHVASLLMSVTMFVLALDVAGRLNKIILVTNLFFFLAGLVVLLNPGAAIEGARSIGYSVTRINGPFYWVFQVLCLAWLALSAGCLIQTYRTSVVTVTKRKAAVLLLGLSPMIFVTFAAITAMQLGYPFNAAVVGSFATLIFMATLIASERREMLFKIVSFLPATEEYKMMRELRRAISECDLGSIKRICETSISREILAITGGNISEAARRLNVSRNTMLRMKNRSSESQ